jgi:hypothetical protein
MKGPPEGDIRLVPLVWYRMLVSASIHFLGSKHE